MPEYFRITGSNLIPFDYLVTGATDERYTLESSPVGMDEPLSRQEVLAVIQRLPKGTEPIKGHALKWGLSRITFPFTIKGSNDRDMEDARHDLMETLEEGKLFITTEGASGTRAVLQVKANNAVNQSYKTVTYGEAIEKGARHVLGAEMKKSWLLGMQMTLYCEPFWRPESAIPLGPNEIYCPGLEEDGDANGRADYWTVNLAPVLAIEPSTVLQGHYSQKVETDAANEGIISLVTTEPATTTQVVAYVWVCRPEAGSDILAEIWDVVASVSRATATYNAATVTAIGKDGSIWRRLDLSSNAIVPGNVHTLHIFATTNTPTTFYVDKCFWKWDTMVAPDEWCDHWMVYNHYDTTEGAAHEGHQNYFDAADLKGTNEARLLIQVEFDKTADKNQAADLIMARRSWWDQPSLPGCLVREVHWLEAEDRTGGANWTPEVRSRCSGGGCVFNGPAGSPTGNVTWHFWPQPCLPNKWMANYLRGRFDVFGMVYATNHANTGYRLSYSGLGGTQTLSNLWVKQKNSNQWQLLYLGEVSFDRYLRDGIDSSSTWMQVAYAKDAGDTTRLDCVWLVRKSEPTTRLHVPHLQWLPQNDYWVMDQTGDFDYRNKEYDNLVSGGRDATGDLFLQGPVMTLTPRMVEGQRLYFCCETVDLVPAPDERIWEAHGAEPRNLQLVVSVSYLPQFVSPLE